VTTFSQMVDAIIRETKRPDMLQEIAGYLNATIRDVHMEPERGNAITFWDNLREIQFAATSQDRQTWDLPRPEVFQTELCVRFDSQFTRDGKQVFARKVTPGAGMDSFDYYYYRGGPTFAFGGRIGYGGVGSLVSVAWFEFPRALKYYPVATRDVTWDEETGWAYGPGIITPEQQIAAQARHSNWLLDRWAETLKEGLRAKVYKRLSDETRQRTSYSLFMQQRQGLVTSEQADLGGPY
jgi:hypothetical protein